MGWFRRNVRGASRLALLAMAIQLVLSFSHVHLDNLPPVASASVSLTAVSDAGGASPAAADDPICGICILIQLAGTSVQPATPTLDPPQRFDWTAPVTSVAVSFPPSLKFSFNARAPPSA